jgi:hypothetical protein
MLRTSWVHPQEDSCKRRFCGVYLNAKTAFTIVYLRMIPRGSKYVEDVKN